MSMQTHTTFCTLYLVMMIVLTSLGTRFIDHLLSAFNSKMLQKLTALKLEATNS